MQLSTHCHLPSLSEKVITRWEETSGKRQRVLSFTPGVNLVSLEVLLHNARSSKQTIILLREQTSKENTSQKKKLNVFYMVSFSAVKPMTTMNSKRKFRAIKSSPVVMFLCWKQSARRLRERVGYLLFINVICFCTLFLGLFKLIAYWWIKIKYGLNWVQNKAVAVIASKTNSLKVARLQRLAHTDLYSWFTSDWRCKVKGLVCSPSPFPLALFSFLYLIINYLN